jgi:ATP-dependent Clp protease, protease subunit
MAFKKIIISGEIGFMGTMPADIRAQLAEAAGGDLDIQISSPGGSVFDGFEIYNMIRDYKRDNPTAQITITLKGEAASVASYLAVNPAADMVVAEDNAVFMIHNAWNLAIGDYREMEKAGNMLRGVDMILAKAYADATGKPVEEMQGLMNAETFFFGDEIKAAGFVDEIIKAPEEEQKDRDQAVAVSKVHVAAMLETMRKSENAKAEMDKIAALFKHEIQASNTHEDKGAKAPENNNGGNAMADNEDKNLINADDITLEWLQANKPEIVDAIKNAAADGEKERIKDIEETEEESEDESEEAKALFKAAKYGEKPMNSGDVAKQLFAMQAAKKKQMLADRKEDAEKIPATSGHAAQNETAVVNGIIAGMKAQRRIK